jgi:hypothetical protein
MSKFRRRIKRYVASIAVGVAFAIYEAVTLPTHPFFIAVSLAGIGYGIADPLLRAWRETAHSIEEYPRPNLVSSNYEAPYDAWSEVALKDWHAIHDPKLNAKLIAGMSIATDCNERTWLPDASDLNGFRELLSSDLDADEAKIRLGSDLLCDTARVSVQKTPYSAFLVTNKLGISILHRRGDHQKELIDPEAIIAPGGRIPQLLRSRCSNHLGVDILAVTSSGKVLLTRQTRHTQLSKNLLAPSGSGSMDWADLRGHSNLVAAVTDAMQREMCEELGLGQAEGPGLGDIRVLGYARLTHLGGKPQFFGVARLGNVSGKVRPQEKRYVHDYEMVDTGPSGTLSEMLDALQAFETKRVGEFSFPLYLNFLMLRDWMTSDVSASTWLRLSQ